MLAEVALMSNVGLTPGFPQPANCNWCSTLTFCSRISPHSLSSGEGGHHVPMVGVRGSGILLGIVRLSSRRLFRRCAGGARDTRRKKQETTVETTHPRVSSARSEAEGHHSAAGKDHRSHAGDATPA